jgi:hypothetical protein
VPTSTSTSASTPVSSPTNNSNLVPQINWTLAYVDSQETRCENGAAVNGYDGSSGTIWHTQYCGTLSQLPHEIQIDMGSAFTINGFHYLPRQDGGKNGRIGKYEFYGTNDLSNWGTPVATGTFANDATLKEVLFTSSAYRYIRLRALTEANGGPWTSAAEISVLQSGSSSSSTSVAPTTSASLTAVSKANWKLAYVDSQETQCENGAAVNAFDSSASTIWHTQYCPSVAQFPHEIQIDMGAGNLISGFRYLARQDGGTHGRIGQYEFYATNDLSNWGAPVATGTFANDATEKQALFAPNTYRYIRLRALTEANGGPWVSMAELTVLQ